MPTKKKRDTSHLRTPEVRARAGKAIKAAFKKKKAAALVAAAAANGQLPPFAPPKPKAKSAPPAGQELALELVRLVNRLTGGR